MLWTAVLLTAALAATDTPAATTTDSADGSIHAGLAAFKRRNFRAAEAEFEKAVQAEPNSAAAHFYLGYTIYKRVEPRKPFHPDKQRAAAEFAKAYELDPGFAPEWGKSRAVARDEKK